MPSPDIASQMERASFCAGRSYSHMAAGMDTGREGAAAGEGSVFAGRHMSVPTTIRQQHCGSPALNGGQRHVSWIPGQHGADWGPDLGA